MIYHFLNYTFEVVTLWDQAHVTNNNVYVGADIIGSYTNSLDNGVDVVSSLFTNEISVTKTGELAIVGYQTNSVVRFKRLDWKRHQDWDVSIQLQEENR